MRGGPVSWTDLVSRRDDFCGTGSSNSLNNNFYEVVKKTARLFAVVDHRRVRGSGHKSKHGWERV